MLGPRMYETRCYVARNPGCPILPVAEHVGPNGSRRFGYRTVHRCLSAGLLQTEQGRGCYVLTVTDKGWEARAAFEARR